MSTTKVELFYIARASSNGEIIIQEGPFGTPDDCRDALSTKHAHSWKKYTVLRQQVEMDVVDVGDPWEYSQT